MKALVTGAAGFIGSSLAAALAKLGYEVVGVDALTDYYDPHIKRRNLSSIGSTNFSFLHADLNDMNLVDLVSNQDFVFHQAGQPGVRKSWGEEFVSYVDSNIRATQSLLEACRDAPKLKKFVYASSSSVYGNALSYPTPETALPQPVSPYGVSKLAGEHLVGLYASNFGLPGVSLRYFTVYGPGQRPDMAFTRFIHAALTDGEVKIFGQGKQVRDFTYVDDIVAANIAAATADTAPGSVFNVSGGSNISVNEVLDIVQDIHGQKLRVSYTDPVAGDVNRTSGANDSFSATTHWSPQVNIEAGLRRQYLWTREL